MHRSRAGGIRDCAFDDDRLLLRRLRRGLLLLSSGRRRRRRRVRYGMRRRLANEARVLLRAELQELDVTGLRCSFERP
jgi:hypothetical protein